MGPDALRIAGIARALEHLDVQVDDLGNLSGPCQPTEPTGQRLHALEAIAAWNRILYAQVGNVLRDGRIPIVLGGDHSLGIGSIAAVADHCRLVQRPLRVLWLDAHADCNTEETTPSGNVHGLPVACLCGQGPRALTHIGAQYPALAPGDLRQIGVRSIDAGEKLILLQLQIEVFGMRRIDEVGMRQTMEQALAGVTRDTHLHVSFDVDFLDPGFAFGVTTPVPGGPTYRDAQLCMEMIADTGCLRSLDIVEVNPATDVRNQTAVLAVDLVQSLFGKSTFTSTAPTGTAPTARSLG